MKKYGKSKWTSVIGKQNAAAVKALTKKTNVLKLTADLTDIILAEEAFDLNKGKVLIELGFDGEKFRIKPADESEGGAEKAGAPTIRRKFDPREKGLQIVEKAKTAEGGAWNGNELSQKFRLSPARSAESFFGETRGITSFIPNGSSPNPVHFAPASRKF
jgi:hypothetical protein